MGKKAVAAAALVAAVILLLLVWVAGEARYRNCLTEADLRHPAAEREAPERNAAIDDCSRWP